jgi:hypothetical protein
MYLIQGVYMKKIFQILVALLFTFVLVACDDIVIDEDTFDESLLPEMIQTLSLRNNDDRMSMDELSTMIQTGAYFESDVTYELQCGIQQQYFTEEDGTFIQTYTYYDYNNDIFEEAIEILYNGIDDDNDGIIDEDDEIMILFTDEMFDGIDNNNDGIIDELFEQTPTYVVSYTLVYNNETTETTTSEDGTVTTVTSFSYTYTEVKTPYTGQIIEVASCFDDEFIDEEDEFTDEETSGIENDFNGPLLDIYINLSTEIQEAINASTDQQSISLIYAEITLGRSLTDEEKEAIQLVWDLYFSIEDTSSDSFEVFDSEIEYVEFYLGRSLTEQEIEAFDIVSTISASQSEDVTLEQLISLYETILNRLLTDLEKEAIALYEFYGE